jgi:hypothetical protein
MDQGRAATSWAPPGVTDYGDLFELTSGCQGFGMEDGSLKINDPFIHSQPDFGDPGLCN